MNRSSYKKPPKGGVSILVNSVDSWSDYVGSDTLSSLMSAFSSENVASLNIRARKSDSKVAGRYFHIIEGRVMRSIFSRSIETGEEYTPEENIDIHEAAAEEKRYGRKIWFGRYILVLLRELVWKFGHWKSEQLDSFIEDFNPDVLFFPIEGYIHFNRINQYIIDKYHPARVIGYMWDDNFTYKQHPCNLLYRLHRWWLRKSVKSLVRSCDVVFAISPKLKRELDTEYGIDSVLLTKPIREDKGFVDFEPSAPLRLLYTGKLIIGRDRTVAEVAEAMKVINKDCVKVVLDIYTNTTLTKTITRKLAETPGLYVHGFVPQQVALEEQRKADILLFLEALSNKDMSARLSFSTKITDYLSSGKCIWAIGNEDLAPIEYLRENDAAIVSTSKLDINKHLSDMVEHKETIRAYARKAYECGVKKHSKDMIQNRFNGAILGTEWGG